jgi:hypothetical protein
MAQGPADGLADRHQRELQYVVDGVGRIGGNGDGPEKLQLLFFLVELPQPSFGDRLRLQAGVAFPLEAAPEFAELVFVIPGGS